MSRLSRGSSGPPELAAASTPGGRCRAPTVGRAVGREKGRVRDHRRSAQRGHVAHPGFRAKTDARGRTPSAARESGSGLPNLEALMWKRSWQRQPQQRAAARYDTSLAERSWREAAVDRRTCWPLLSSGSQVRVLPGAFRAAGHDARRRTRPTPRRRPFASTSGAGRTIQAFRLGGTWAENGDRLGGRRSRTDRRLVRRSGSRCKVQQGRGAVGELGWLRGSPGSAAISARARSTGIPRRFGRSCGTSSKRRSPPCTSPADP